MSMHAHVPHTTKPEGCEGNFNMCGNITRYAVAQLCSGTMGVISWNLSSRSFLDMLDCSFRAVTNPPYALGLIIVMYDIRTKRMLLVQNPARKSLNLNSYF